MARRQQEDAEIQARVDRIDRVRDAGDPDYQQSMATPRKRRATNDDSPRSAKKKSPGHQPFDRLKADTKKERKAYVATIRRNWGSDVERWMGDAIWPCRIIRLSDHRSDRRLVRDPKDWNGRLLEELSYLSKATRNQPEIARRALEQAIVQRQEEDNDHGETQVLKEDAQRAIELCNRAGPSHSTPAPTDEGVQAIEQADMDMPEAEEAHGSALRSPTLVADVPVVKSESRGSAIQNVVGNVIGGAWTGFDDEMEKLKEAQLEAEELEAVAAAKRKQREVIAQRRRIREQLQHHGAQRDDAIFVRSE